MKNITSHFYGIFLLLSFIVAIILFPLSISAEEFPHIDSEYVYLVDFSSNQILYEKNSDERIFPASMTKMMTEIIAIESVTDIKQRVKITPDMLSGLLEANAAVAGFSVGDTPTIEDLLYATALPSGADAVNALVNIISGTSEAFVEKMNQKALEIGMTNTHFENATGLHHDNHYSTCKDISTLLRYCIQNDTFRKIISTRNYISGPLESHPDGLTMQSTVWKNVNQGPESILIPGFEGGKTGYTARAGYCLASTADINNMKLLLVTAKNPTDSGHLRDAGKIYEWVNSSFEQKLLLSKEEVLKKVKVQDTFPFKTIDVQSENDIVIPIKKGQEIQIITTIEDIIHAPVNENDVLGTIQFKADEAIIYEMEFTSKETISRNSFMYLLRITLTTIKNHLFLSIFLSIIAISMFIILRRHLIIAKKRRMRRKRKLKQKRRTII